MSKTLRKTAPSSLNVAELHAIIDPIEDYAIKIHKAAVWYAEQGIHIVPFLKKGYPKGLSQRHATCSKAKIDEWFHPTQGEFPGASIAMAHGGSAGYCAIDLDTKDADGIQNLADLQEMYGRYEDSEGEGLQTLMAITPSGGRHLVFRYHPEIISNSEFSYPGIDSRGGYKKDPKENGGITFVEPSMKPDGSGSYRWDENVTEILDIPQWLVDILNKRTPVMEGGGIKLQESYVESAPGLHGDGRDRNIYMDLLRFAGIGYTEEQLWDLMPQILERMYPPDPDMVARKIESVIQSDAYSKAKEEHDTYSQVSGMNLVLDSKNRIVKCVQNLDTILKSPLFEHEYGSVTYDDFLNTFIHNNNLLESVSDWSIGIQLWIAKKFKVDFPKTDVRAHTEFIAYDREHSNVAREYMLNCPQPGPEVERDQDFWGTGTPGPGPAFKRLCYEVLDLSNPDLHPYYDDEIRESYEAFLWFWMKGVAARACVPGCKMEMVLNIFGHQGIGKSLFFRELCPDYRWFTDSIQDTIVSGGQNNRDELLKILGKLIVEMPELNPMKRGGKSADDKFKQFLSAQTDRMRKPYGHDSVDYPRTCAFGGTANNHDIYRDPTGARRFISINHGKVGIRVGDLDNGTIKEIRDSMWGEIVSSFKPGELNYSAERLLVAIPPKLREWQNISNDKHRFEEVGMQEVIDWMSTKTRVTWLEITAYAKTSVAGLRDEKEAKIQLMVRSELERTGSWEYKRSTRRLDPDNNPEKVNAWINYEHDLESYRKSGKKSPAMSIPHWSTYDVKKPQNPEY